MFIFDKPYVSEVLIETCRKHGYPVLHNDVVDELGLKGLNLFSPERFADRFRARPQLYSNSENAITWINENLAFSDIVEKADLFKNKVKFRDLLSGMFPDFYYREVMFYEISSLSSKDLRFPFIIKPSIGFFSLGVYYVQDAASWKTIRPRLIEETEKIRGYYPEDVLNSQGFIIEEVIRGVEYAIDAYYDNAGEPVILNVLKHNFAGAEDVSDRVYITSVEIIKEVSGKIRKFLTSLGRLAVLHNFPFHIEVRIDEQGRVVPVELNPLRFAGWCCTDIAHFAYGINTYEFFADNSIPDMTELEKTHGGKTYALVVVEKSAKVKDENLIAFDYEKLKKSFSKVLEIRETDYVKYGVFCFMFVEVESEESEELKNILNSDLSEYLIYY